MGRQLLSSNGRFGFREVSREMSKNIFEDRRKQPDRRRSKRPDGDLLHRQQISDRRRVRDVRSTRYWWLQANYASGNSLDSD